MTPTAATELKSSFQGRVTLWLDWSPTELKSLREVITSFQDKFPEITFAIGYYPTDELRLAVDDATTSGTMPSLLFAPSNWGPELWQAGLVVDLSDLVKPDFQAMIDPVAFTQVVYGGEIIGLPVERQGIVLYRNRELVSQSPMTIEELLARSQIIQNKDIVGAGLDFGAMYSVSQLTVCGGTLFGASGNLAIGNDVGHCWLRLFRSLKDAGEVVFNADDDLALFEANSSAWLIESSLQAPQIAQAVGVDNLAVDPWPVYGETGERLGGFVWTENIYLLEGSSPANQEASWAFVLFLLTPEAQLILSAPDQAGHLPALSGLELDNRLQSQLIASLSAGVSRPLRTDLDLYLEPLEGAIRAVVVQGASPELALDIALKKIEQALLSGEVDE